MTTLRLLAATVLLLSTSTFAKNCETFDCFNDSTCADSTADFSGHPTDANGKPLPFHVELERDGKHCECQPGWTGLRCAREYESCADSEDHKCYNGGNCLPGVEDAYGNKQMFCDCTEATDDKRNSYEGKYCELVSTNVCSEDETVFCVNGGVCKNRYMDHPDQPCRCDDDHAGPHCEFKKDDVPDCDMDCQNDGVCKLGLKRYVDAHEFAAMDSFVGMYCECPMGWYGEKCQIESEACGDHHCFHGGQCISQKHGDAMKQTCDCTDAKGDDGTLYGGRYCQYEATNYCGDDAENGQLFCVNGGKCNPDGSHLDCECPEGFHGPICEFADTDGAGELDGSDCSLECQNGGQCRNGLKDTSFLDKFGLDVAQYNEQHKNFEYCVCPEGWIGVQCEHEVQVCGDGEHACFHGSKCVKDGSKDVCDCDSGFNGLDKLAGTFCQHKSTVICTPNAQPGLGQDNFAFCVNGGSCLPDDGGCSCPNGWEGPHCEFREGTMDALNNSLHHEEKDKISSFGVFMIIAIIIGTAVTIGLYVKRRRTGKELDSAAADSSQHDNIAPAKDAITVAPVVSHSFTPDGPAVDMGPSKTLDGDELENVEII